MNYYISKELAKTKAIFGQTTPVYSGEVATFGEFTPDPNQTDVIQNYAEILRDLIVEQFEESADFHAIVGYFAEQVQDIEDKMVELMIKRDLELAEGDQLDGIGEIVGEPRYALEDKDYREAIHSKIMLNKSGGEINTIIDFVKKVAHTEYVHIIEQFPATIKIHFGGTRYPKNIRTLINNIAAAGVKVIPITVEGPLFAFQGGGEKGIEIAGFNKGRLAHTI